MTCSRLLPAFRVLCAIAWLAAAAAATAQTPAASAPAAAARTLRAEVANPVNAAQDAARAGQKEVAEAKLREAAAVPDLSMFEQAVIERTDVHPPPPS